jgi:4-amino-4-deoxy-L-arabinose transferase-like glycosyltransferase
MSATASDQTETRGEIAEREAVVPSQPEWRRFVWPISIAIAVGLVARLVATYRLSVRSSDSFLYEELARNWLRYGIYGVFHGGVPAPTDLRLPGYPAFIAGVYRVFGESLRALTTAQAFVDVLTCIGCGMLSALIAPRDRRMRAATAAIWLAALSPSMIGASATALTETLSAFFTVAVLVVLALVIGPGAEKERVTQAFPLLGLLGVGLLTGMGTLVRPEAPLLLVAVFVGLLLRFWRTWSWRKLTVAAGVTVLGMALPLAPWTARSWRLPGEVHLLTPLRPLPGSSGGYTLWLHTWLWRAEDRDGPAWASKNVAEFPPQAFDSPQERALVGELLSAGSQNSGSAQLRMQQAFASLASRRTERHPLRTLIIVPAGRAWTMWFDRGMHTRHILLGSIKLDNAANVAIKAFAILSYLLAIAGACLCWRVPVVGAMVALLVIRTGFFTLVDVPEPRYMLVLFPIIFALAGRAVAALSRKDLAWSRG